MDIIRPHAPLIKIRGSKSMGKHNSEAIFQKFSNTYPMIVAIEKDFRRRLLGPKTGAGDLVHHRPGPSHEGETKEHHAHTRLFFQP
jgi:hypothetical protein